MYWRLLEVVEELPWKLNEEEVVPEALEGPLLEVVPDPVSMVFPRRVVPGFF